LQFIAPFWTKIIFVLLIFALANAALAIIPVIIGKLVETLSTSPIDMDKGWLLAWILVGLSTGHDILWRAAEFAYRAYLTRINYDFENVLFQSVITRPYAYFVSKLTGKIGSYITLITSEFRQLLAGVLFDFSGQIVNLVAMLFILGSLNWQTGLIFALGLIGMIGVGRHTLAYNMKYEARSADTASNKNGALYDIIGNYGSVKAFHAEVYEASTIGREQTKAFEASQKAFFSGIIFWASMSFFVRHLMWPAIILLNVWFFSKGQLTVGELATLLSTVLLFSNTIWQSVWFVSQLGQQLARIDEAYGYLMGDTTTIDTTLPPVATPEFQYTIDIANLTFAYPDKPDRTVLHDIALTIRRGEKIGIVGHSGSGKTTLTKLLLDFYPAPEGSIKVDGKPMTGREFAKLVSFVPQDTALFHRTITDNIRYGSSNASLEEVQEAARQASADEFIATMPDGYDTLIGERGAKVSGGQRQRIAIARAILQNRPILILDEATSALDSESEAKIQRALDTLWQGKTVIAVAHRLSTLRTMDRIIVMENGRIVEDGSHEALLQQKGIYAKLWNHQSGGFIEE
jgi:ATP-binding cassette subfamily B protein